MNPSEGGNGTYVAGAGTAVLVNYGGKTLKTVDIPGTGIGTIKFYDTPAVAGTTAGNLRYVLGLAASTTPASHNIGFTFQYGIEYEMTGTLPFMAVWY